jgi:hypothetical protein
MTKFVSSLVVTVLAFAALLLLSPSSRADIVEVEAATGCPGSIGGGLCDGGSPFNLTTLLSGGITVGTVGTEKFVVTDTTGSFSFVYTGASGDNGSCQVNGGAMSFFGACTGSNSDGSGFSLGHDDTHHPGMNPPTTITFTAKAGECTPANPCSFDLGFVSWQGTGVVETATIPPIPEPGTLSLLAAGLFSMIGLVRRKS